MISIVTGGCGFIGSHIVDHLVSQGHEIISLDNFTSGNFSNPLAKTIKADIRDNNISDYFSDADCVYHFAANPDVRASHSSPQLFFENNIFGTYNVLEAMRKNDVERLIFASTSAVYGLAKKMPTPETEAPAPISIYGASKSACESLIASYSHNYGIKSSILRLANIYGERLMHGVIYDFYNKLKRDPNKLEILGDGKQSKSFLYISDCIDAIMIIANKQVSEYEVYNVGSETKISVDEIAKFVSNFMGLNPTFIHTGKTAWLGDVELMLLDISKLKNLGFRPKVEFYAGLGNQLTWYSIFFNYKICRIALY
jgi:UDP-glucose 4-epimerase